MELSLIILYCLYWKIKIRDTDTDAIYFYIIFTFKQLLLFYKDRISLVIYDMLLLLSVCNNN